MAKVLTPRAGGSYARDDDTGELTVLFMPGSGMPVPDDLPPPDAETMPEGGPPPEGDDQTAANAAAPAPDGPVDLQADLVGQTPETPETPATADQADAEPEEHI